MLLFLAQATQNAPEPSPAGWTAVADSALRTASTHQDVLFPLLAVASPFAIVAGLAYVFIKFALPAWQAEKALDRTHADERLKAIRTDCTEDLVAARALASTQHEAIVQRVEQRLERNTGEIAKLTERSERHGEVLRSIAQKLGAGILLVVLALGIAGAAARIVANADAPIRCSPACNAGFRCVSPGVCQEIKTGTATASGPHSALRLNGYANVAAAYCTATTVCP